jgi:hypothetical protein
MHGFLPGADMKHGAQPDAKYRRTRGRLGSFCIPGIFLPFTEISGY